MNCTRVCVTITVRITPASPLAHSVNCFNFSGRYLRTKLIHTTDLFTNAGNSDNTLINVTFCDDRCFTPARFSLSPFAPALSNGVKIVVRRLNSSSSLQDRLRRISDFYSQVTVVSIHSIAGKVCAIILG